MLLLLRPNRTDQREGMGLLEYQAMPSLRDIAHDGVFVSIQQKVIPRQVVWSGQARHGQSITYKITPRWVTLLQPARRDAVLGHPSSLRPH